VEEIAQQAFLAFEVVEERALGDVGSGSDFFDGGRVEAFGLEKPFGGFQQASMRALLPAFPTRCGFGCLFCHN